MATLQIHGVPDELHEALRRRAKERGSSISDEAIRLLELALAIESRDRH